ncbi:dsDNA nuclease domain-containing protein [Chryseobacterium gotjawalense]|uniref:DsDNA nuclease domain-containing protein n=1 Tax=Chryseobacterium gotjawalense TaxID=3042315 RepID=A0ABY8RDB1_9FLAO|nr:dsDNA nuclease domain-containing protein [Chryseobacterium sp. wdc7]WHF51965.1 dsDNA nuclease domain-containing protein [Chryseobacterium sp. wdc7]
MEGSASQAGFYYQNNVAALQIIDCLFYQSDIREVMLENYKKGNHIDDIIVFKNGHTDYFQVKWSEDEEKSYTLSSMLKSETGKDTKKSLFKQLAEGYVTAKRHSGTFSINLYTTKKVGRQKRPSEGLSHSLSEVIGIFFEPLKSFEKRYDEMVNFDEYQPTIEKIRAECALDENSFDEFIKSLEFRFEQAPIEEVQHALKFKMETLGIEKILMEKLLNAVVKWSISGHAITKQIVLRELGILERFEDKLSHYFKVIADEHYVANETFFSQLEKALSELPGGYIFIEGLPGIGKSTSLTKFKMSHKDVTLAYYCFIPDLKNNFGELRHQSEYFLKSLCIAIEKSFPHVELPNLYSERYQEKLSQYIDKLSTLGEKIIFIIDGLDHVHRDTAVGEDSLLNSIKGHLPENIFFILSSQYSAVLSPSVLAQIDSEPQRYIKVIPFNQSEIKEYLHNKGVDSAEILNSVEQISGGIPLYLHYISEHLVKSRKEDFGEILSDFPQLAGGTIDLYHEYLFQGIKNDSLAKWVLAVLAYRKENTELIEVKNILSLAGEERNLTDIENVINRFSHLLKQMDGRSYAIFHNSFREFIISKTPNLKETFNTALSQYYKQNPFTDDAYRNYFKHLFELRKFGEIISMTTLEWAKEAWRNYRSIEEININIDLAVRASIEITSLPEFIRLAFLKDQFGQIGEKMDNSEIDLPILLLRAGELANSLRYIWDGDFVLTSKEGLCFYLKEYFATTGNLLPANVITQGFSKPLTTNTYQNIVEVYKAEALFLEDILPVFSKIDQMRWSPTNEDHTDHMVEEHTPDENEEYNNSIKLQVIEYLGDCKQYRKLLMLERELGDELLKQKVRITLIKLLLLSKEKATAISKLKEINFGLVEDEGFIELVEFCTDYLTDEEIRSYFPSRVIPKPVLPNEIIDKDSLNSALSEEVSGLFKILKVLWIFQEETIDTLIRELNYVSDSAEQIYESIFLLSRLWHEERNGQLEEDEIQDNFEECIENLYGDEINLSETRSRGLFDMDSESPAIARNIKVLFADVFAVAFGILSDEQMKLLVNYWMENDDINNAFTHYTVGLTIAEKLHKSRYSSERELIFALIQHAENRALSENEATTLTGYLGEIAGVYGICGFKEDFKRIYNQMLNVSFGLGSRKDYQTSNIIGPLEMIHQIDPDNTLKRLSEVFHIQDKLKNAGNGRMHHIVLSNLIRFVGKRFPDLAFKLMEFEEENIDREETLDIILKPMIRNCTADDIRLYLAIVKTMARWSNGSSSEGHFRNVSLLLLERAIFYDDREMIQQIVDLMKFNALTELDKPEIIKEIIKIFDENSIPTKEYALDLPVEEADLNVVARDKDTIPKNKKKFVYADVKLPPEKVHQLFKEDYPGFIAYIERALENLRKNQCNQILRRLYNSYKKTFVKLLKGITSPENLDNGRATKLTKEYVSFKEKIVNLIISEPNNIREIKSFFNELVINIADILQSTEFQDHVEKNLNVNKWLDNLLSELHLQRNHDLQYILPDSEVIILVDECPLDHLDDFVEFIDRHTNGKTRTLSLLKICNRFLFLDLKKAKEILSMLSRYEYDSVLFPRETDPDKPAFDILTSILREDVDFGKRFLLHSYYIQKSKYNRELTLAIDKLLKYKEYFEGNSIKAYYEANLLYNKELSEGISPKEDRYEFILEHVETPSFKEITVQHLIWLFNYPVVKIRELTLRSAFDMFWHDAEALDVFVKCCIVNGNDNEIEHGIVVLQAIALKHTEILAKHKDELFALLDKEHFNIVQTGKELLNLINTYLPGFLSEEETADVNSPLVQFQSENLESVFYKKNSMRSYILSRFQIELLKKIDDHFKSAESIFGLVYDEIKTNGRSENPRFEDAAVQRKYNINTNFDNIEIQSHYYDEVKSSINRVFYSNISTIFFDQQFISGIGNDFRLYDPSTLLYQVQRKADDVNWFTPGISEEDFIMFNDFESIIQNFVHRLAEFVPLVEIGSQRQNKYKELSGTCYFDAKAFLKSRDFTISDLNPLPFQLRHNMYAYDIPLVMADLPPYPVEEIKPIVQVTSNNFRGVVDVTYANLTSDAFSAMGLQEKNLLQIILGDEESPLKASEWIGSYASGPGWRRFKPGSHGLTLEIKKKNLLEYLENNNLVLCYKIEMRRSTDTDRTENIMNWHKLSRVVEIDLLIKT